MPRPSATLAVETEATYSSHNRSHILPPICEGIDDHVDLDLTGTLHSAICSTCHLLGLQAEHLSRSSTISPKTIRTVAQTSWDNPPSAVSNIAHDSSCIPLRRVGNTTKSNRSAMLHTRWRNTRTISSRDLSAYCLSKRCFRALPLDSGITTAFHIV